MLTERLHLWDVAGTVSLPTTESVKPEGQAAVPRCQGKQLELLHPFPLRIVTRLQARHRLVFWLIREQARELDRGSVRVQPAQVDPILPRRLADQFPPDHTTPIIDGVQHPTDPVIIHLIRLLQIGMQRHQAVPLCPIWHIVQRLWLRKPTLNHQLSYHAMPHIRLLGNGAVLVHNPGQTQTTQKRSCEHQWSNYPSFKLNIAQSLDHRGTSLST